MDWFVFFVVVFFYGFVKLPAETPREKTNKLKNVDPWRRLEEKLDKGTGVRFFSLVCGTFGAQMENPPKKKTSM